MIKVKKLHPDAALPEYATAGAACFDLVAVGVNGVPVMPHRAEGFRTGLAFEIPEGHVMLVFSRSGHGFKNDTRLANCVGVIDSDYRGELMVKLTKDGENHDSVLRVMSGDRIAQALIMPVQRFELQLVDELTETARGTGGLGSTGR